MDPLDLDSFLNPSPEGGDSTPGEHLRRGDSEENVYALLDDRPEHDLTPPRGLDTVGGSSHGFGIEMASLEDAFGGSALRDDADLPALSSGARAAPAQERLSEPMLEDLRPESAPLSWDDDVPLTSGREDDPLRMGARDWGEPPARDDTGELSDGIPVPATGKVGLHSDEEARRSLRERIARQQRERSRQPGPAPRRRTGLLMLVGGTLILATVAAMLVFNNKLKLKLFGTSDDPATSAGMLHPGTGLGPISADSGPLTVEERLRRSLAFGLPVPNAPRAQGSSTAGAGRGE